VRYSCQRTDSDLADETVAVRTDGAVVAVQDRIGAAPGVEIAAGQDDLAIDAIGQRRLRAERVQRVGEVSGKADRDARPEGLVLVKITSFH